MKPTAPLRQLQRVCHDAMPWLISLSLGPFSRAFAYRIHLPTATASTRLLCAASRSEYLFVFPLRQQYDDGSSLLVGQRRCARDLRFVLHPLTETSRRRHERLVASGEPSADRKYFARYYLVVPPARVSFLQNQ